MQSKLDPTELFSVIVSIFRYSTIVIIRILFYQ